jgi:rhodanese-related sulfurtransferase
MKTISREELQAKLERGDDFKLVMTLGEWAFQAKHIPGSINIARIQEAEKLLQKDEEIVVYCSDPTCISSQAAYRILVSKGFTNVRRYSGGLTDWEAAGLPLEGEEVGETHA